MSVNELNAKDICLRNREMVKADWLFMSTFKSDQSNGVECPPLQMEFEGDKIALPEVKAEIVPNRDIVECIRNRQSRRKFTADAISLDELSFLLWATQGVRKVLADGKMTMRTVPSGGSRHPFETYLAVHNVSGLDAGLYVYLPLDHSLGFLCEDKELKTQVIDAALEQKFVGECAVTFIWSAIPYRSEWRYTTQAGRLVLQDSGHLCQNLYLACEALGLGTCAIGAYDQDKMDDLLQLDGVDEFVVYVAPVGRI